MKAISTNRKAEIKSLATQAREEKIRLIKYQLEIEENSDVDDMSILESETIELRSLFGALQDFNTLERTDLLCSLHSLVASYADKYPERASEAISTFADINHLITGLYYHKDLIERKLNEYSSLADEINELNTPRRMTAS